MGRKIEMKKINDPTRCQVTFSKRRSSLLKKANEIAVCCDTDVAFLAFSPCGRLSKFCGPNSMEDVLQRYIDLSTIERYIHLNNVEEKMERLDQLTGYIAAEANKLHYLDKQIENLKLQIQKSGLQLKITETGSYEFDPENDQISLQELLWCEINLKHALEKVMAKKDALARNICISYGKSSIEMNHMEIEKPPTIPFLFSSSESRHDSWMNSYGVGNDYFQDGVDGLQNYTSFQDLGVTIGGTPNVEPFMNKWNFPIFNTVTSCTTEMMLNLHAPTLPLLSFQESLKDNNQTPLSTENQSNNNPSDDYNAINFSDAISVSTQRSFNINNSSFALTTLLETENNVPLPTDEEVINGLQFMNSIWRHSSTSVEEQEINRLNKGKGIITVNNIGDDNNEADKEDYIVKNTEIYGKGRWQSMLYDDNILLEEIFGDNLVGTSKMQKDNLLEWEDMDNENFQGYQQKMTLN